MNKETKDSIAFEVATFTVLALNKEDFIGSTLELWEEDAQSFLDFDGYFQDHDKDERRLLKKQLIKISNLLLPNDYIFFLKSKYAFLSKRRLSPEEIEGFYDFVVRFCAPSLVEKFEDSILSGNLTQLINSISSVTEILNNFGELKKYALHYLFECENRYSTDEVLEFVREFLNDTLSQNAFPPQKQKQNQTAL